MSRLSVADRKSLDEVFADSRSMCGALDPSDAQYERARITELQIRVEEALDRVPEAEPASPVPGMSTHRTWGFSDMRPAYRRKIR